MSTKIPIGATRKGRKRLPAPKALPFKVEEHTLTATWWHGTSTR